MKRVAWKITLNWAKAKSIWIHYIYDRSVFVKNVFTCILRPVSFACGKRNHKNMKNSFKFWWPTVTKKKAGYPYMLDREHTVRVCLLKSLHFFCPFFFTPFFFGFLLIVLAWVDFTYAILRVCECLKWLLSLSDKPVSRHILMLFFKELWEFSSSTEKVWGSKKGYLREDDYY